MKLGSRYISGIGLLWTAIFVGLDALQAAYFGYALRTLDSFLVGTLVFGFASAICIIWTIIKTPQHLSIARRNWRLIVLLNVSNAAAWIFYLLSVQTLEPAIAFAIFSGCVPFVALFERRLYGSDEPTLFSRAKSLGISALASGLILLIAAVLLGWSGLEPVSFSARISASVSAIASGVAIGVMLMTTRKLDAEGLSATSLFGLRFPLYLVLSTLGVMLGLDAKSGQPTEQLYIAVLLGFLLLAWPVFAVQKAIHHASAFTVGVFAATTPLLVFLLQFFDMAVSFSSLSLIGLALYAIGSILLVADRLDGADRNDAAVKYVLQVSLWFRAGKENAAMDYERQVEKLIRSHHGEIMTLPNVPKTDERKPPNMVQRLTFPSSDDFQAYMNDPRRIALTSVREAAIEHTEITEINGSTPQT